MKTLYQIFLLLTVLSSACEPPKRTKALLSVSNLGRAAYETFEKTDPSEEYIMVGTAMNMPMFVNHDQKAFSEWGKRIGVKTSILGPSSWDVPGQIDIIEQVIPSKPAGLLVLGADPGIAAVIRKAVAKGIPTVVYDSEVPNSGCHSFVGSDWYLLGKLQGERMVKLIKGKGKVACLGILGLVNMERGFQGFLDVIKGYPDIEFVGKYNDNSNVELAVKITADLISAHPELTGIAGFDSNSGPGIGLAVKEAGLAGQLRITSVDAEPEHLMLVKEGVIDYLVGQKRELFGYLGGQFLYDMRHKTVSISGDDAVSGAYPVPDIVHTGAVEIDQTNVDVFLKPKH